MKIFMKGITFEDILARMSMEDCLAGFTVEELEIYLKKKKKKEKTLIADSGETPIAFFGNSQKNENRYGYAETECHIFRPLNK